MKFNYPGIELVGCRDNERQLRAQAMKAARTAASLNISIGNNRHETGTQNV